MRFSPAWTVRSTPSRKASLGWVQRGGQDLLGLINEILDLSKIEAGKVTHRCASHSTRGSSSSPLWRSTARSPRRRGSASSWHDAGTPAEVVLDRQRVRQILVNLVGNALKFTESGEVDGPDRRRGRRRRSASPSVTPARASRRSSSELIFEEFHQAEGTGAGHRPRPDHQPPSGASRWEATSTLESEPGQGSTFTLHLPLDCRPLSAAPAGFEPIAARDGERVLLCVDDDPSVAPLLQKMLVGYGYRVVASRVVAAAVADAQRVQPAAILIDLRLREGDGADLLGELKADPSTRGIPVIIVSATDPGEVPDEVEGYLSKPVQQNALLQTLEEHASTKVDG